MKQWISHSYLQPTSKSYYFLYTIQKHFSVCLLLSVLMVLAYPLFESLYCQFNIAKQQQLSHQLTLQIEQETARLNGLKQYLHKQNEQSQQFHHINRQIKQILNQHQSKTEQFQWYLEQENRLYLQLNQQSTDVLSMLTALNQLEHFYATEITLTKLNQQRLIQLSGIFLLLD